MNYKKATVADWRDAYLVTSDKPNDKDSGAFEVFRDYGQSAISDTFAIGASASGTEEDGQVGVALDAVAYDARVIVYSGVCEAWSEFSGVSRATPTE